jgi:hypothetical protein
MDLGGWLRSIGLQQYEAVFRENAIDETVLLDLSDQDLEKVGRVTRSSPEAPARYCQP